MSFDSICKTCFKTIASEASEFKLIPHEERHICDLEWHLSSPHNLTVDTIHTGHREARRYS